MLIHQGVDVIPFASRVDLGGLTVDLSATIETARSQVCAAKESVCSSVYQHLPVLAPVALFCPRWSRVRVLQSASLACAP